jgi:hypothetical protein
LVHRLYTAYQGAYEVTVKRELVIHYTAGADVRFVRVDGKIAPNGEGCDQYVWEEDPFFKINGGYSNYVPAYSLALAAEVVCRVTTTRRDGTDITEYVSVSDHDEINGVSLGPWGRQLNKWCGFRQDDAKELPYTEQAAQFFYNAMLSLVRLADNMHQFFKKPPEELMASMSGLLLPGTTKNDVPQ